MTEDYDEATKRIDDLEASRGRLWADLRNGRGERTLEVATLDVIHILAFLEVVMGPFEK